MESEFQVNYSFFIYCFDLMIIKNCDGRSEYDAENSRYE